MSTPTFYLRFRVRRWIVLTGLVGLAVLALPSAAAAHGVLVESNPLEGAGLDTSPTAIILSFSEEPEPSLASITVTDEAGVDVPVGEIVALSSDPLSIRAQLPPLDDGVYTVAWRIVSRVDGHATAGAYAFGVGITPDQAQLDAAASADAIEPSVLELAARWLLLGGLVVTFGATVGNAAGFAGPDRGWRVFVIGWIASIVGLVGLALAQRASAAVSLAEFFDTYPGRAVIWRGVLLLAAGIFAIVGARLAATRPWSAVAAAFVAACIAVHVAAGHAAAAPSTRALAMISQWSHIVAAAAWIGGLLTLVVGLRRSPEGHGGAVRRFSTLAAIAVVLVGATGTARAIAGLGTPSDLISTSYGIAISVKICVFLALCGFGLAHRLRSVPVADTTTAPLRRLARPELVVAAVAIVASGILGSLSPPAEAAATGFSERAADTRGELTAELTTDWKLPGPNQFRATFDGLPDDADAPMDDVTLRFRPLDDPTVPSTTLRLEPDADAYVGRGSNLAFPGRWEVALVAQQGSRSWTVPFTLTTDAPPLFSTLTDVPGYPPEYIVQLADNSFIIVSPFPARDELLVRFTDFATAPRPIDRLVVTATDATGATVQLPLDRVSDDAFTAAYEFPADPFVVGVVARGENDERLYATFEIDPNRPDA